MFKIFISKQMTFQVPKRWKQFISKIRLNFQQQKLTNLVCVMIFRLMHSFGCSSSINLEELCCRKSPPSLAVPDHRGSTDRGLPRRLVVVEPSPGTLSLLASVGLMMFPPPLPLPRSFSLLLLLASILLKLSISFLFRHSSSVSTSNDVVLGKPICPATDVSTGLISVSGWWFSRGKGIVGPTTEEDLASLLLSTPNLPPRDKLRSNSISSSTSLPFTTLAEIGVYLWSRSLGNILLLISLLLSFASDMKKTLYWEMM